MASRRVNERSRVARTLVALRPPTQNFGERCEQLGNQNVLRRPKNARGEQFLCSVERAHTVCAGVLTLNQRP